MTQNMYFQKPTLQKLTAGLLAVALILIPSKDILDAQNMQTYGVSSIPSTFSFTRDIKQGDTIDPDVKYLQLILNSNPATRVAETGPGSNSEPSAVFGALTKDAVSRFQNLYKAEILTPAGLTSPTGSVGTFTRNKLNSLIRPATTLTGSNTNYTYSYTGTPTSVNTPSYFGYTNTSSGSTHTSQAQKIINGVGRTQPINIADLYYATSSTGIRLYTLPPNSGARVADPYSGIKPNSVFISTFSAFQVKPAQVVSIFGSGFQTTGNNVFMGPVFIGKFNASNNTGSQITFIVPDYIPRGFYEIGVSNVFGTTTSNGTYLTMYRATSTGATVIPTIESITPSETRNLNDTITIKGSNFTLNNTVMTNLGNIYNLPSYDTETIIFAAGSLPYYGDAQTKYKGKSINLSAKVSNESGVSKEETKHTLAFSAYGPTINQNPTPPAGQTPTSGSYTGDMKVSTTTVASQGSTNSTQALYDNINNSVSGLPAGGTSNADSGGSSLAILGAGVGAAAIAGGVSSIAGQAAVGAVGSLTYFGGQIIVSIPCTCSASTLIYLDNYVTQIPTPIMYQFPISTLNQNFNVWTPGVYVVGGLYPTPMVCLMYVVTGCVPIGYAIGIIDTIRGVGTSLY